MQGLHRAPKTTQGPDLARFLRGPSRRFLTCKLVKKAAHRYNVRFLNPAAVG
jgi:hypothetical protein